VVFVQPKTINHISIVIERCFQINDSNKILMDKFRLVFNPIWTLPRRDVDVNLLTTFTIWNRLVTFWSLTYRVFAAVIQQPFVMSQNRQGASYPKTKMIRDVKHNEVCIHNIPDPVHDFVGCQPGECEQLDEEGQHCGDYLISK